MPLDGSMAATDGALEEERRLSAFSAQLAIALQNAQLFSDVMELKNYNEGILKSLQITWLCRRFSLNLCCSKSSNTFCTGVDCVFKNSSPISS